MDISVLASIGSFMVSEHVLKPKASVLVILGCVLAYDLTTKTHDVSSLRVYRGPGLLAFALTMVAFSLRTWRRNGVACDELLFLPGTPHADNTLQEERTIGVSSMSSSTNISCRPRHAPSMRDPHYSTGSANLELPVVNQNTQLASQPRLEGDVAAGVGAWTQAKTKEQLNGDLSRSSHRQRSNSIRQQQVVVVSEDIETTQFTDIANMPAPDDRLYRSRTDSRDSTISSINELDNDWDDDPNNLSERLDMYHGIHQVTSSDENLLAPLNNNDRGESSRTNSNDPDNDTGAPGNLTIRAIRSHVVSDIREGQAQITRFGSLFFFRSSTTNTQNAVYAPSGPSVVGAALDLSMPILFNFHLFIQAWNHLGGEGSTTTAKILPMCFLTALTIRTFVPFGRRGRFWGTLKYTLTAPFQKSRFRDSFLGDVLTSLVRPLQDIAFCAAYYVSGLWGVLSSRYNLSESADMLESSWVLHTVILPSCALLPLWWRFLQALRESYDYKQRWPYLGNAFKFLSAAAVIMYGMTHPEQRNSLSWMLIFFLNVLYQIWWDTFIDWELFVIVPCSEESADSTCNVSCVTRISSLRPSSHVLFVLQRYILNPLVEAIRHFAARIPSWRQFQIRPRRLYKSEIFYWRIFLFNTFFRFTWMLSFIPSYSLSKNRVDPKEAFESDTNSYIGVLLPVAEIFRRTLWGILLLEIQTIHMTDGNKYSFALPGEPNNGDGNIDEKSESAFSVDSSKQLLPRYLPSWLASQIQDHNTVNSVVTQVSCLAQQMIDYLDLSTTTRDYLFQAELCVWAAVFAALGIWATG